LISDDDGTRDAAVTKAASLVLRSLCRQPQAVSSQEEQEPVESLFQVGVYVSETVMRSYCTRSADDPQALSPRHDGQDLWFRESKHGDAVIGAQLKTVERWKSQIKQSEPLAKTW